MFSRKKSKDVAGATSSGGKPSPTNSSSSSTAAKPSSSGKASSSPPSPKTATPPSLSKPPPTSPKPKSSSSPSSSSPSSSSKSPHTPPKTSANPPAKTSANPKAKSTATTSHPPKSGTGTAKAAPGGPTPPPLAKPKSPSAGSAKVSAPPPTPRGVAPAGRVVAAAKAAPPPTGKVGQQAPKAATLATGKSSGGVGKGGVVKKAPAGTVSGKQAKPSVPADRAKTPPTPPKAETVGSAGSKQQTSKGSVSSAVSAKGSAVGHTQPIARQSSLGPSASFYNNTKSSGSFYGSTKGNALRRLSSTSRAGGGGRADLSDEMRAAMLLISTTGEDTALSGIGSVNELKHTHVWCDVAPSILTRQSVILPEGKSNSPLDLFAKCVVLKQGKGPNKVILREIGGADEKEFETTKEHVWLSNTVDDMTKVHDVGMLPYQSIPCVLEFLHDRYRQGCIYTMVEPLLVAINPFKDLGNTTSEWIVKYRDEPDVSKLSSHVFATARVALDNLHGVKKSQSIIVSGESGAGKTEATKQIMRYFGSAKEGLEDAHIQKAVLAANPVLEAFGNAKTIRNNNSSRFGRFMQLQVGKEGGIQYGTVKNFLLEKSRILTQDTDDRSYHVFYQLVKGSSAEQKTKFKLLDEFSYNFINTVSTDVPELDDAKEFKELLGALEEMGLAPDEIESVLSIVSGVLLMGNVKMLAQEICGIPDAAAIDKESKVLFKDACELLFLDPAATEKELTTKTTMAGNQVIEGPWRLDDGQVLKESLSKAMYDKLFDHIIARLNTTIQPPETFQLFIGMLDIFGFEVFKNNSLEQLFINITNERLQKNFIDIVFERETKLYHNEGISSAGLVWTDNRPVIELLCNKKNSILAVLEDQCLAPGGSDKGFLRSAVIELKDRDDFKQASVNSEANFVVTHTIGDIQYCSDNFLLKNKDVLRSEMVDVVMKSNNETSKQLFEGAIYAKGKLAKGQLIGSQFMSQLEQLMEIINATEPHFVRCVKPNDAKMPLLFDNPKILIQIHALSILEALQLRNLGFSYRRPFHEFLYQFKYVDLGIAEDNKLDEPSKCRELLKVAGVNKSDWQVGKTMLFMKTEAMKAIAAFQRQVMATWLPVVKIIEAMYLRKIYRKQQQAKAKDFVRIQSHIRKQMVTKSLDMDPFDYCLRFPFAMLYRPVIYSQAPTCPYPMPSNLVLQVDKAAMGMDQEALRATYLHQQEHVRGGRH
eukprot:GHVQ01017620.1.p2 GENE.GHVQ01017620.1~~GHVQ01017620.1.p2  ORF type:complete len:1212 (-),score=252.59 GHVQ01017620.1:6043-9678(-)